MKQIGVLCIIMLLAACGKPASTDTTDSLAANSDRLSKVMHECQEDHAKMGNAVCKSASEAFRRRFMGNGSGQYTPQPVPQN